MKINERIQAPTPKFFKKVRNIGIALAAAGGAIIAAPVALPAALVSAAGYLVAVGGVMGAISQATVNHEVEE